MFQILFVTGNFDGCQSFEIPTLNVIVDGWRLQCSIVIKEHHSSKEHKWQPWKHIKDDYFNIMDKNDYLNIMDMVQWLKYYGT